MHTLNAKAILVIIEQDLFNKLLLFTWHNKVIIIDKDVEKMLLISAVESILCGDENNNKIRNGKIVTTILKLKQKTNDHCSQTRANVFLIAPPTETKTRTNQTLLVSCFSAQKNSWRCKNNSIGNTTSQ